MPYPLCHGCPSSGNVLTRVWELEGDVLELAIQEVLGGSQIAQCRTGRVRVRTQLVDHVIGQLSQSRRLIQA